MCKAPKDNSAAEARAAEEARQARIKAGMGDIDTAFAGFTPAYFDEYAGKNLGFWRPEIDQQYKDAQRDTTFGLARTGNLKSTAATDAFAKLREKRDKSELEAADRARGKGTELRQNVEQSRAALVSQLNATADPFAAASAARAQAETLTAPPLYSPVGDLFSNLTAQFAVAQQARQAGQRGWGVDLFTTSGKGGRGSSVTYT